LARAKRTDRTEARRRYRAEQAALAGDAETIDEAEMPDEASGARGQAAKSSANPARPSITAAFRGAVRPLDWRADLRELPKLVRHWSLLLPVALSIGSTVVVLIAAASITETGTGTGTGTAPVSSVGVVAGLLYQFFLVPPPMAGAFLAGLAAPRASWLIGAIFGVVSALGYAAIVLAAPDILTGQNRGFLILEGLVVSPLGSALFASMAAWYRRFLNLSNPNRSQRATKPSRGRGNMPTNSRAAASRRS
jgi:hypothetical protein